MTTTTERYRAARDLLQDLSADYAKAVAEFAWPDLGDRFNWAVDWFDAVGRGNDRTALWIVDEDGAEAKYSFDEMARRSDQAAAHLAAHGVVKGDRVLLMLDNQVELWEAMLAVMKLGAIILPTTTALGPVELVDRIERGGAKHVLVNTADAAKFDEVPGEYGRFAVGEAPEGWVAYRAAYELDVPPAVHPGTAPSDPQLLYFTSGTTSRPKLVEHTQVSYPVGHLATSFWVAAKPGDVHLNVSSPGWAKHAWSCFFAPWIAEATIFVYNYSRFDAAALLKQIRRAGVNTFCAPPTVWRMLIKADLSGGPGDLRQLMSAGEPLNPEVMEQVQRAWGLTIRDGFGQTELPLAIGNVPGMQVKPGSMGLPLPGVPIVLVDPVTGEPANEGEICVDLAQRPMSLMTGYQGDPERDAEAMAGGYYHTGDVASRDEDGYIFYIGRTDDVFKASDYKISPFELESVLIEHPAVAEAAVVPAPDEVRLAVPKAYISLAAGYEPNERTAFEILKHAREGLAPYQRVRRLEFFELPKTISGKIRRVDLRGREVRAAKGEATVLEYRDDQFPELRGTPA
ncbi:AMP-binding protein [Amycolatopsis acidiphila]|uniref:AMP-binding protein n=1 Tax=Amycolatopsis acidiphila TaxID=715473 RepID=A0A558AD48_9PSEU|nr:AMP-binding protein [Amycolatopsis acidiphila]TVT22123.1 AMP-binding protein [Amycolatopsis acidiphila]UIJ61680.1 AMP-binding protein [Amycolatopsis acidiphila]GHG58453.1 AMP-dependent synthetase [Amycolatopsis acidiphila]